MADRAKLMLPPEVIRVFERLNRLSAAGKDQLLLKPVAIRSLGKAVSAALSGQFPR